MTTIEAFKATIAEATDDEVKLVMTALARTAGGTDKRSLLLNLKLLQRMERLTRTNDPMIALLEIMVMAMPDDEPVSAT